jgi:hypothetical protein
MILRATPSCTFRVSRDCDDYPHAGIAVHCMFASLADELSAEGFNATHELASLHAAR